MSSIANRVIKNTGYLYAKMGITMFVSLYTTRLILNSLGASDFGIFNIVGGAIAMLGFLNAAMASATQRFMSYSEGEGDKEKQKSIFNVSLILHLGISLVVGIALFIAGYFFFNGILNIPADRIFAAKVVYGSLIVSTMFTVMTVPYDAAMNAHENMKYYAVVGILESFLKLAVAFACVYTTFDKLIVYGSLMACIPLITLTIMRIYCHKHYAECIIAPRAYWNRELMKKMGAFAGWNFMELASSMISFYGLGFVLNIFFGALLNAAQGIANQLSGQLGALGNSMKKAINPIIAKSAGAHSDGLMIQSSKTGTKTIFFIGTICFSPIIVDAEYIFALWLKNPPPYTYQFCVLVLFRDVLQNLTLFIPQAISAKGKIKKYTLWGSVIGMTPFVLSIICFSIGLSPYYMYYAVLLATIGRLVLNLYYGQKLCNINAMIFMREVILKLLICFAFTIIAGYLVQISLAPSFIRFLIITLFTFIIYTVSFYWIGLDQTEKRILSNVYMNIKNKLSSKYHR